MRMRRSTRFEEVAAAGLGRLSRAAIVLGDLGAAAEFSRFAGLVGRAEHRWARRVAWSCSVSSIERNVERVHGAGDSKSDHCDACTKHGKSFIQYHLDAEAEQWCCRKFTNGEIVQGCGAHPGDAVA